ncbi:hypothetical protein ACQP2T_60130 [Nonomuraea sp. CA-143628]|uniref:hypothetical protein n=1 Tax=Nonomuraea sp. CA-143628 TaxID=3239997 RepID=UPI003D8F26B0
MAERHAESPHFIDSPLPPIEVGDWLLKPATRIAETFSSPSPVADWLVREYLQVHKSFLLPVRMKLKHRLDFAMTLLSRAMDVQWNEWLKGGMFISIAVVCCPNRHVPHACPLRPVSATYSETIYVQDTTPGETRE